jgi:hypothetical protein
MGDITKPRVDVSDLGTLENEEEFANGDEYEKHQNATTKEVVGNYVRFILAPRYLINKH